jgi:serine protease
MNLTQLLKKICLNSNMKLLFSGFFFLFTSTFLHAQKEDHVKGQLIVHLKNKGKVTDLNVTLNKLKSRIVASKSISDEMNIWLLDFDESSTEINNLVSLRNDPSVLNVQFNHFVSLRSSALTTLPNDPTFNSLWHLLNTGQSSGTAGADIQATLAWDITTGGKTTDNDTIVVAVIDNGFEPTHADIQANHWYNWNEIPNNGIDDDANGYVDDFNGWDTKTNTDNILGGSHAVEVEGLIGAVGNNNRGVTGVNWKVKMMSIKIDTQKGTESDIVAAYAYALKMRRLYQKTNGKKGAFVVATNSSFGTGGFPVDAPIWCAMYDTLGTAGILSVGSTDNSNSNVDVVGDLPSTCPSDYLVMVTATDRNDVKGQNSAYGVNHVDVAAPGVSVQTTATNSSYIVVDGTSFACPIVTGIAALAYAAPCADFINLAKINPSAATLLLKDWILKSVDLKPSLQNKIKTGGRVNAFKTLQKALSYCTTCQQPSAIKTSFTNTSANFSFSLPQNASFNARYRLKGTTTWITINAATTPLSINDLLTCTDYELELVSKCNTANSIPFIFPFKTEGCCVPPEDISFSNITQNQFALKFSKIQAASQYSICINNVNNLNSCIFEKTTADTNFIVTNLKLCNTYKIAIKSLCTTQLSAPSDVNVKTMGCGPCFDQVYCKTGGSSISEWIDSFSIADFKFKSGKNGGYIKFDTIATVLKSGKKYQLSLKPAYSGTNFNESLRVWIDFNGDGDFEDANEKIWEVAKFNATVKSDSIVMPDNFIEGITRMRVSMKYLDALALPPQYCDFFDGEVEDYCVKLEKTTKLPILISKDQIHIFPNPFSNTFTIKNGDTSNRIVKLELIYPDGRVFYVKNFDSLETEFLVSDLPHHQMGLIFVKIETVKGVIVKKMMRF